METFWDDNTGAQMDSFSKELTSDAFVNVSIFHKPRGGGGQSKWVPIEENERVRVSSKSGRLIVVTAELFNVDSSSLFQLNSQNCQISLLHREDGVWKPVMLSGAFETISCEDVGLGRASFNVRISCRLPKVAIHVAVMPPFSDVAWSGQSVQFTPHNSGASKVRGQAEPVSPENGGRMESDSASSPTAQPVVDFGGSTESVIDGNVLVHGTVSAREFLQYSDIRLKTDISDISNALDIVQTLQGKTYRWKRGARSAGAAPVDASHFPDSSSQKTIGFIAQEVQRILPELVKTDQDGFLSVAYAEMVPILIEAFKEHLRQYQQAKEDLKRLESQQLKKLNEISHSLREIYERVEPNQRKRKQRCFRNATKHPWLVFFFATFSIVTTALVITIAVLLTRSPPPGVLPYNYLSWTSAQTLSNTTFEAPDAIDSTKAAGWSGAYMRTSLDTLPPSLLTDSFDQGKYVILMNGSNALSSEYSDCEQSINVSSVLNLQGQGLPLDTRVWGSVTASVWVFIQPLSQGDKLGELRLMLRLFQKGNSDSPIAYVEGLRLPSELPGQWTLLNVTDLELPLAVSNLDRIDFAIVSTISVRDAVVAVDVASLTFKFRSGAPPSVVAVPNDIVEPSPPITQPNITSESILSSMSISFFWNCTSCRLSFSATPDVHTAESVYPAFNLRATGGFFYHLSDEKRHKISANFATNGSGVAAQFRLLKLNEFWTNSIRDTTNGTLFLESSNCTISGTGAYQECSWTFQLDRVLIGSSLEISFTSLTAPYSIWMKDVFMRNLEVPLTPATTQRVPSFANVPLLPVGNESARTNCPHQQPNLDLWATESSWFASAVSGSGYGTVTVPPGRKVLLSSSSVPEGSIIKELIIPNDSELIFDDAPITLRVGTIRVFGKFQIGSDTCQIFSKLTIIFDIEKNFGNMDDTKGIIVSNGAVLSIHGKHFAPTWTRLAQSAYPASDKIFLQQGVNWEVGQQVLIATSFSHDASLDFHETMTIAAVRGNMIQFTKRLKYLHYANLTTYQTEVALLSRRIVLQGDPPSMDTRMSGYILANGSQSTIRLSGVELFRMGQYNSFMRDSVVLQNVQSSLQQPSFISDCSFNLAHYRCVAMLGASGVLITRNICFRPRSHGFMLMYGSEENNTFAYNLVARPEFRGLSRDRLPSVLSTDAVAWKDGYDVLVDPSEPAGSGFFISNPRNLFVGNAVSGGWAGYLFAWYDRVLGGANSTYIPSAQPFLGFDGNTVHSTASDPYVGGVHFGAAMNYVNNKFSFSPSRGLGYRFQSRQNCMVSNTKVWLTSYGYLLLPHGCSIVNSESWDNRAAFMTRGGSIDSSLVSFTEAAWRTLPSLGPADFPASFIGRYGIEVLSTKTAELFIQNTTCSSLTSLSAVSDWTAGYCILNRGPQEKLNLAVRSLSFLNTNASLTYLTDSDSVSALDFDGSLTGQSGASLAGGKSNFWAPFGDCNRTSSTSNWACPVVPGRGSASARARFDLPISVFNATLCNNSTSFLPTLAHVNQGEFSVFTGDCVYLWTDELPYSNVSIEPRALPQNIPMFLVLSIPSNLNSFTVQVNGSLMPQAGLLEDLSNITNGVGSAYFQSSTHIYLRAADITGQYPVIAKEGSSTDFLPQLLPRQPIQVHFDCTGNCNFTVQVPGSIAHIIGPR